MNIINIIKNLTTINRTRYTNRSIEYIVVHYFGALGSAEDTCAYFKSVNRRASAHYFVDDAGIWQAVEDKDASWHCGDSGRGKYKDLCSNANSIGIEVRPYKVNTGSLGASDTDWYFHDKTISNLTELVKSKMAEYGIDADHVIRHYDVTGKWCPRPWLGDDTNTYYGKTGNALWAAWKNSLEEPEMTGKEIYDALVEYLKGLEPSTYAKDSCEKAITSGLFTDGNGDGLLDYPQLFMKRQDFAVIMDRKGELK